MDLLVETNIFITRIYNFYHVRVKQMYVNLFRNKIAK